jgi:hypothetical protein
MRFQVEYLMVPLGAAFDTVASFDRATRAARVSAGRPAQPTPNDQKH